MRTVKNHPAATRRGRLACAVVTGLAFAATAVGTALAPAAQAAEAAHAAPVGHTRMALPTTAELRRCQATATRMVVCVDLNAQRLWVMRGRSVVFAPVPVRTGRRGHPTRTGRFHIYWRHKHHWSSLYDTPMPFSQFFSGGEALHGVYGDIHQGPGSYGCVNLTIPDASRLWRVTSKGTLVEIWGHKPDF